MRFAPLFLLVPCAALCQPADKPNPAVDLQRGQKLFKTNCAGCHGIDGHGGSGPSLARAKLKNADDDSELEKLIIAGIPSAGMPSSWYLLPDGPRQLTAYVRSIGKVEQTAVEGDAERGRTLFERSGCARCHIVRGAGNALGPELTDIGARRTPAFLMRTLTNPAETIPEGFVLVRIEAAGKEVRGIRLNEDSFSIQLKDAAGTFHSFRKTDVTRIGKEMDKTPMPSFASLPAMDLRDIVAYLASLRGEA